MFSTALARNDSYGIQPNSLFRSTRVLRARYGHGGESQRVAALRRQVLLENNTPNVNQNSKHEKKGLDLEQNAAKENKRANDKEKTDPLPSSSFVTAPLDEDTGSSSHLKQRNDSAQMETNSEAHYEPTSVSSLTDFLNACRQYKISFGFVDSNETSAEKNLASSGKKNGIKERSDKRREFVSFWNDNIESAIMACFYLHMQNNTSGAANTIGSSGNPYVSTAHGTKGAVEEWGRHTVSTNRQRLANKHSYKFTSRDFSFIASQGLSDHRLHCTHPSTPPATAFRLIIQKCLQILKNKNELNTLNSQDMCTSLQFIAREFVHFEKQMTNDGTAKRNHNNNHVVTEVISESEINSYKRDLCDLILNRLVFFFINEKITIRDSSIDNGNNTENRSSETKEADKRGFASVVDTEEDDLQNYTNNSNILFLATADDAIAMLEILSLMNLEKNCSQTLLYALDAEVKAYFETALKKQNAHSHPNHRTEHNTKDFFYVAKRYVHENNDRSKEKSQYGKRDHRERKEAPNKSENHNDGRKLLLNQENLVIHLFDCIMFKKHQLKFTKLVQTFSLLRIFLPLLTHRYNTPYFKEHTRNHNGDSSRGSDDNLAFIQRLSWTLANALYARDKYFSNGYHFVKIANTLARLPPRTLVPISTTNDSYNRGKMLGYNDNRTAEKVTDDVGDAQFRDEIASFQSMIRDQNKETTNSSFAAGSTNSSTFMSASDPTEQEEYTTTHNNLFVANTQTHRNINLSAVEFWKYFVSKGVIFLNHIGQRHLTEVSNHRSHTHSHSQKEIRDEFSKIIVPLYICIKEKRNFYLDHVGENRGGKGTLVADDLLLPLYEEVKANNEDFDMIIVDYQKSKNTFTKTKFKRPGNGRGNWGKRQKYEKQHRDKKKDEKAGSGFGKQTRA